MILKNAGHTALRQPILYGEMVESNVVLAPHIGRTSESERTCQKKDSGEHSARETKIVFDRTTSGLPESARVSLGAS
jgi:hypothetical protein